jgi:prefoldin subunit 5
MQDKSLAMNIISQQKNPPILQSSVARIAEELVAFKQKHQSINEEMDLLHMQVSKLTEERDSLRAIVDDYDSLVGSGGMMKKSQ